MRFDGIDAFLSNAPVELAKGPVAMIFAEDEVELSATLAHHLNAGFRPVLLFAPAELFLDPDHETRIIRIDYDMFQENAVPLAVNRVIEAAPGAWMYYCFNAEFLFFPFCETRNVREMLAFHTEERRDAMLTYVIDIYAADLDRYDNGVNRDDCFMDGAGYYALARYGTDGQARERQLDFFGGLRWRFEEHVPWDRRRIDRIALFRAKKGLRLQGDHTFNDAEYNTYSCPWHHNLTAAICSFRTAKALRTNPGSRFDIHGFMWFRSVPFAWQSQQLMDLGLMEPGQWF